MKLIFITREGYSLPGARIRCYNFAKELLRYGIDTEVFSFSDVLGAKDGAEESKMRIREKIGYNFKAYNRLVKEKDAVLYVQRFNYHSFAPYLIHIFNKNRIILDLDDWEMRDNPRYYFKFYPSSKAYYLTKQLAKCSNFCVAASRFLERFLLQFNSKTYYIPSAVDTELFNPVLNNSGEEKIIFSWIGTFHKEEYIENIEFALSCFNNLRREYDNIFFDIVGDGIYRHRLVEMVKTIDDSNIRIKGEFLPDLIPSYLADIHIGLYPVVTDNKFNRAKSPTKLFEYMAMAKPTLSGDIGESVEVINDGKNGFLAKNKEQFIEKMKLLIINSDLRQQMGKNARETVEKEYSLEVQGKRLYEILRKM